jgi:hypothetical protein
MAVANGGNTSYIDADDYLVVTFDEAVAPTSIHASLDEGSTVSNVTYSETGGVSVSSSGLVTIRNIATFDLGSVGSSGTFNVWLALNSTGKVLTITLSSGSDLSITSESFGSATQVGGTVEDLSGNEMAGDSSITAPTGSF